MNFNEYLRNNLTILVCSCDSYDDLWAPFFKLFSKYWPNCPCEIILNTEQKTYTYEGLDIRCFSMYKNKCVPYGKRIISHIRQIQTPYLLLLMDDFFFMDYVDIQKISDVLSFFDKDEKAICFNFESTKDEYNFASDLFTDYFKRPVYGPYKHNFQASIWKTDLFLKQWRNRENQWEWEVIGTYRTFNNKYNYYTIKDRSKSPIVYRMVYYDWFGVVGGKWDPVTVPPLFSKENILIDYSIRGFATKKSVCQTKLSFLGKIKNIIKLELKYSNCLGFVNYVKLCFKRIRVNVALKRIYVYPSDYLEYTRIREYER